MIGSARGVGRSPVLVAEFAKLTAGRQDFPRRVGGPRVVRSPAPRGGGLGGGWMHAWGRFFNEWKYFNIRGRITP